MGMLDRFNRLFKPGRTRTIEAGQRDRRTGGWHTAGGGVNSQIRQAQPLLRSRARDLAMNNPFGRKAVQVMVSNVVGAGIMPRAATGNARLDQEINDAFKAWQDECDAAGQTDYYGLQSIAARAWFESGESLTRRRPRRVSDGLAVPLQLQVLEGDFLDDAKNDTLGNGRVVQGVEFDPLDRRRAYWLYKTHPGELFTSLRDGLISSAVPAGEVAHLYEVMRPGQVRGIPMLAPVAIKLRHWDDYEEADAIRKKTEACLVGALVTDEDEGATKPGFYDADGQQVDFIEPGMLLNARGGKSVTFNQPTASGGGTEWRRDMARLIAAGARIPYELLTGDLSQVNFSSSRVGRSEFRRMVEQFQWHIFIPMWCRPTWRWFIDMAYASGRISAVNYGVEWQPPAFESVNPLQDAVADRLLVRLAAKPLTQVIAERGYAPADVFAEIAATNKLLDDLGIVSDADPRRVTQAGGAQPIDPLSDEDRAALALLTRNEE